MARRPPLADRYGRAGNTHHLGRVAIAWPLWRRTIRTNSTSSAAAAAVGAVSCSALTSSGVTFSVASWPAVATSWWWRHWLRSSASCAGTCLGLVAGYYRGVVSEGVLRVMDAIMAFPVVTLTLLVVAMLGPSVDQRHAGDRPGLHAARGARGVRLGAVGARPELRGGRAIAGRIGRATSCSARFCRRSRGRLSWKPPYASATRSSPARRSAFSDSAFHLPAADWGLQIADARTFLQSGAVDGLVPRRWRSRRWSSASTWSPTGCRQEPPRVTRRCSQWRTCRSPMGNCRPSTTCRSSIDRGEAYGLVGESGSGKIHASPWRWCATWRAAVASPAGRIVFDGQDVLDLDDAALRAFRGRRAAVVYQNPGAAPWTRRCSSATRLPKRSPLRNAAGEARRAAGRRDAARRSSWRMPTASTSAIRISSAVACSSGS